MIRFEMDRSLRHSFATHGLPHIIVTDIGASFTSNEFKKCFTMHAVKYIPTDPYHPSPNGPSESGT